jgi:probable selenium-dependent hydroxylase accessory protein YqeC
LHSLGRFDITLVKADGARMRLIKAPNPDEPLLPEGVATILPIVSARVFGKPLSARIAHRPERLAAVIDAPIGVRLAPLHVARLLTSSDGALHRVGSAHVFPIINMVDSPELLSLARQAAKAALAATDHYDRIILTSMTAASPVIDIVGRSA